MRGSVSRVAVGAVLALAASLGACAKKKPTEIIVSVESEAPVPRDLDALEVQVDRGGATPFFDTYNLAGKPQADAHLPGTLTLQKQDGEDAGSTVTVTLRARLGGASWRVVRRARLGFVDEKSKLLRMALRYSCLDFPCDGGLACVGGECKPRDVAVQSLPDFDDKLVAFSPLAGVCFDESTTGKGCFVDPVELAVDASTLVGCELDVGSLVKAPGAGLNVALRWAGAIDPAQYNALDQDPEEGWSYVAGSTTRLKLSAGLCSAFSPHGEKPARVTGLRVSTRCAPKTAVQPRCDTTGQPRPKTLTESACFQCTEQPPICRAAYDLALAAPASHDFLACVAACEVGGAGQEAKFLTEAQCPSQCHAACAPHIPVACQPHLGESGCAEYAPLAAYVYCLDVKFGTANKTPQARSAVRYNGCKSACDAEGFQNVCLLPGAGGAGGGDGAGGAAGASGTAATGGASGVGGASTCGPFTPAAACAPCVLQTCLAKVNACGADPTCACCAQKGGGPGCATNGAFNQLKGCECTTCSSGCASEPLCLGP